MASTGDPPPVEITGATTVGGFTFTLDEFEATIRRFRLVEDPWGAAQLAKTDAKQRAEDLLKESIPSDCWEELQLKGEFTFQGPSGRMYKLNAMGGLYQENHNTSWLKVGDPDGWEYLCVDPVVFLPDADKVLLKYKLVMANEHFIRNMANFPSKSRPEFQWKPPAIKPVVQPTTKPVQPARPWSNWRFRGFGH